MTTEHLIISVLSDDKPGVVKALASAISSNGGNWLESRLAQLAGKFAGVIRVAVKAEDKDALTAALAALKDRDIRAVVDSAEALKSAGAGKSATFSLVGPDRQGIVYEISQAFSQYNINVEELTTRYTSMPYSGDPMFEAEGILTIPEGTDRDRLQDQLDQIADTLAMDIVLD